MFGNLFNRKSKQNEKLREAASHGDDLQNDDAMREFKYTPLILATLKNRPELVEHCLKRGDDPCEKDVDHETALSLAIEKEYQDIVDILRCHKAEDKVYPGLSETQSMLKAADDGALGVILNLWDAGNSLNVEDGEGNTPVILAAKAGHIGVVRTLFHFGADINHRNHKGESAAKVALGNEAMLQTLREFVSEDAIALILPDRLEDTPPVAVFTADDMLFGRLSHPFKDRPPYVEDDEDATSDTDGESGQYAAAVLALMDHLESLLSNDRVRAKIPEEHIEHFTKTISEIRKSDPSEVPEDLVEQLQGVVETLNSFAEGADESQEIAPIFRACAEGDIAQLKKFAKSGGDINSALQNGKSLLMLATESEQEKIIDELIKLGVDVNATEDDSFSALLFACFIGNILIISKLIKAGADVNKLYSIADANGNRITNCTALYITAQIGKIDLCRTLIKCGAEIDVMNSMGYTPLMAAIRSGNDDLVQLLLKSGANPDPEIKLCDAIDGVVSFTPLTLAATNELPDIVSELLKYKIDVNKPNGDGWTALKYAAKSGELDMIKQLIKAGASVDQADNDGWTPLMNACNEGHDDVIKFLIKSGAKVNARAKNGGTALSFAEENDCRTAVKILLAADADPVLSKSEMVKQVDESFSEQDDMGEALIEAAAHANHKALKELVHAGADVNYTRSRGQTALGFALAGLHDESNGRMLRRNAEQCIDFLLAHGAKPGIGNPSPFVLAAMGRRLHLVRAMLTAGVDVNQTTLGDGQTALFMSLLAPEAGKPADDRSAVALLQAGADSSLKHESGAMPIHLAAGSNYLIALQELLERRPQDVDAQTNIGITPLMMAATEGHIDAVKLLLKFGADLTIKDDDEMTAKEVAIKNGNEELVPLLS